MSNTVAYIRLALTFLLASLIGCAPSETAEQRNASVEQALADLNAIRAHADEAERRAGVAERRVAAARARPDRPAPVDRPTEPPDLCWQDYCPCESPQGGPDQMLCRQLRAGILVDDELLSIGAGMRDARQQLEDFEAEHGSFDP